MTTLIDRVVLLLVQPVVRNFGNVPVVFEQQKI